MPLKQTKNMLTKGANKKQPTTFKHPSTKTLNHKTNIKYEESRIKQLPTLP